MADRAFVVMSPAGAQTRFDIVEIADELARLATGAAALRVLFDWSQVGSWPFSSPSAAAIERWKRTAPAIARAAFVHDAKWNRQAALLEALLRVGNAEARSFHVSDIYAAVDWLNLAP